MADQAGFELWARSPWEPVPRRRGSRRGEAVAIAEAERLARASGEEGVMSVWVQRDGEVLWAAGEKWRELHD